MKYLFVIVICSLSIKNFAQDIETEITDGVIYNFTHVLDTADREKAIKEQMVLFYSKSASLYKSYKEILDGIERNRRYAEAESKGLGSVNTSGLKPASGNAIFFNYPIKQLLEYKRILSKKYLVTNDSWNIQWTIKNETKKIGDWICQRADCRFRGRNYIVWFCNDIPYPFGPWKLNGLPGLIMEANDDRSEVFFKFVEFLKPGANGFESAFALPKNYNSVTQAAYKKLVKAYYDNPDLFSNPNAEATVVAVDANGNTPVFKKPVPINNPIEKSDH
ncbi:GLPGLI family protein [Pedobacter terrae]|uniref:GLPGLI family protein n=1 Tax=Pedobacter terrae TaxID=405671 RepID=UPI002FF72187